MLLAAIAAEAETKGEAVKKKKLDDWDLGMCNGLRLAGVVLGKTHRLKGGRLQRIVKNGHAADRCPLCLGEIKFEGGKAGCEFCNIDIQIWLRSFLRAPWAGQKAAAGRRSRRRK